MTRGKSATLVNGARHNSRKDLAQVAISAGCTIGERGEEQVLVTDLGTHGCRLHTGAVGLTKAQALTLRLAGCAPIKGTLTWSKGGEVGVSFDQPLSDERLETLRTEQSAPNVVPFKL